MNQEGAVRNASRQAGFSLIELSVAMLITLIITGSIYSLLASGQGAFRREPDLSDRQQNIRSALDVMQRDLGVAGQGFSAFTQVLTNNLNAVGVPNQSGVNTDHLEIWGQDGGCPNLPTFDRNPNSNDPQAVSYVDFPECYPEPGMVLLFRQNGPTTFGWGHNQHSQGGREVNFPDGQQPTWPAPDDRYAWDPLCLGPQNKWPPYSPCFLPGATDFPNNVGVFQMIRYEIATAPGDNAPTLWRSASGGRNDDGEYVPATTNPNSTGYWVALARGIEDLQVEYLNGDDAAASWEALPETVTAPNYATLVRQVRVTLSARNTSQRNLQGSSGPAGARFVHGELTSVSTPRAAMFHLSQVTPSPLWR